MQATPTSRRAGQGGKLLHTHRLPLRNTWPNLRKRRSRYNDFRIFTRGFSAQQAAVYLFSKLSMDLEVNTTAVVSEWAQQPPLSLTLEHADSLAPSIPAASDLWCKYSLSKFEHPHRAGVPVDLSDDIVVANDAASLELGPCSHGINRWNLLLLTIDWSAVSTTNISGCTLHHTSTLTAGANVANNLARLKCDGCRMLTFCVLQTIQAGPFCRV